MNAWAREKLAWDAFCDHCETCPTCSHDKPMYPLCDEGRKLERAWGLADAVAQRAEQEADEAADFLSDCANEPWADYSDRPWSPEL